MKLSKVHTSVKAEGSGIVSDSVNATRLAWFFTALLFVIILLAYRDQVSLVLQSWETMPSHAHGYVVLLVVAYLVWEKRGALAGVSQAPSKGGMAALVLSSLAALAGQLVSAAVVVQFSVVLMLQSAVWAVMGDRYFRILFGPLNFLFFAIPFGHDVLPTLMDWTANATVIGLRASGVPVFQDGRFFIIPSGSWSVIEACAGVRYLLTSFFVGTIFAYITYTSWYKRLIFVIWMLLLSLFANWLRAYVIVMAAHLSNNQWGLGLSHLAFGWVIFAVVVLVSFAVGVRWRDANIPVERVSAGTAAPIGVTIGGAMFAAALVLGFSQAANHLLNQLPRTELVLDLADSLNGLEQVQPALPMVVPKFMDASAIHAATYRFEGSEIGLTVGYYRNQRQGAELINVNNMIDSTHTWAWKRSQRLASMGEGIPKLRVEHYSRPGANAVVATVYWIGGYTTVSESVSKLYQGINLLIGKGDDAAMLVITSTAESSDEAAATAVEAFVRDRLRRVLKDLDAVQAGSER
ncbi:exosortase A [Propionivibrio sp.]|uniref:exosortase A n=1 Tax=Propionivibrio sp. TaxID=2212460 RepID=UPI003BF343A8